MKISKSKISKYSLLSNKKHRDKEGLFVVEGEKAIADSLPYFILEALISGSNDLISKYNHLIETDKIYSATGPELQKISSLSTPTDVIAIFKIPAKPSANKIIVEKESFNLVLDGIQNPGNLGTIIRTAHWFGFSKIYCSFDTADIYNSKTIQATMGSLGRVEVVYTDLRQLFVDNSEIPVYGLLLDGKDIFKLAQPKPGFILMGNEGAGIRENLKPFVSEGLTIPPANEKNHPESLNVSVATAITLSLLIK